MPIPKYDELQIPILEFLSDGKERSSKDLDKPLAEKFNLNDKEKNEKYKSGSAFIFHDRIAWALSYLNMAGMVTKPKRSIYKINDLGLNVTKEPEAFKKIMRKKISQHNKKAEHAKDIKKEFITTPIDISNTTPVDSLYNSYEDIKRSVYNEILETIMSKTPKSFEELVVHLLQKMGYGDEIKDSGIVTQYTNDNGIDGIIKEDILGFGRINIQAKRYATGTNISRQEIQKFVGALATAQSDKGVFITTSDFTTGAYEYANKLNGTTTIVLINGKQLAEYIYDFNLGMQTEKTITIKKMDGDFWDGMEDEKKSEIK